MHDGIHEHAHGAVAAKVSELLEKGSEAGGKLGAKISEAGSAIADKGSEAGAAIVEKGSAAGGALAAGLGVGGAAGAENVKDGKAGDSFADGAGIGELAVQAADLTRQVVSIDKDKLMAVLDFMKDHNLEHAGELTKLLDAVKELGSDDIAALLGESAEAMKHAAEGIAAVVDLLDGVS
jgi:hypothetical protein